MPWGNRSLLFRDPDGNLVNFFTPVTPAAIEKIRPLTTPRPPGLSDGPDAIPQPKAGADVGDERA